MYFIYLQKLLRRGRMIIQCLQLTEALENPQKTFFFVFFGFSMLLLAVNIGLYHAWVKIWLCNFNGEQVNIF